MDKRILNFLDLYYLCIDQFSIRKQHQLEIFIQPKHDLMIEMIDVIVERIVKIIVYYLPIYEHALILVQYGEGKRCIQIQEKGVYSDSHMKLLNQSVLATIHEHPYEE
uniref:Uncharacterized protein n=1 Tax=viral metagenome TaxID=1070528 RepID=A0A6C0CT01_9ZZZZ